VKDGPAIDLVLGLLCVEVSHVCEQSLDFVLDISRQVVLCEDRRRRISNREDRNNIKIASAGMEIARATPACQPWWVGLVGGFEGFHRSGS